MLNLQIIIGSTRDGRNADPVCKWLTPIVEAQGSFSVETLDLRDWTLPMFQETLATIGNPSEPTYSLPLVKRWNEKIKEADAYLLVTPEYNHSVPAVLKNAVDTVFFSYGFRNKPVAFVAYSRGITAGVRAVEHLTQIMVEAEAVPVRTPTLIPSVTTAFDEDGKPRQETLSVAMTVMLNDLAWLGTALKAARTIGELPPSAVRLRAPAPTSLTL